MYTMPPSNDHPITADEFRNSRITHIAKVRQQLVKKSLGSWDQMIEQWSIDTEHDALWIMHAANYLAKTSGVRWAIDPVRLGQRLPEAPSPNLAGLGLLNFVLLTHTHKDHADCHIWHSMREAPTQWVVPSYMLDMFLEATDQTQQQWGKRLIIPKPLEPLVFHGMRVTPFDGLHWEWAADAPADGPPTQGVPATGYLVENGERRWLFPGDTRTYDRSRLPDFGSVDIVFAHVWLGRESALLASPPEREAFCRFFAALNPRKKLILAHLYDTSRIPEDCWVQDHVKQVKSPLQPQLPDVQILAPEYWECVSL